MKLAHPATATVDLPEEDVSALARALRAHQVVRFWITDLDSPLVRRRIQAYAQLVAEDARWRFAPAEGVGFFEPLGWRPTEVRSIVREARQLTRLPWLLRFVAPLDREPQRP